MCLTWRIRATEIKQDQDRTRQTESAPSASTFSLSSEFCAPVSQRGLNAGPDPPLLHVAHCGRRPGGARRVGLVRSVGGAA